jgi:hypothetical protein
MANHETFVWYDLVTPDQTKSGAFFSKLTQVATYTDHVILREVRAKNLRIVWPILAESPEILRRCAPQNDMATNG